MLTAVDPQYLQAIALNPNPIEKLLQLLQLSLSPNQKHLNFVNDQLLKFSKSPGYIIVLLQIANSPELVPDLVQASLAQLKNVLRAFMRDQSLALPQRKIVISDEDFEQLGSTLFQTFVNLGHVRRFSGLLVDIVTFSGKKVVGALEPALVASLKSRQHLQLCLKIVLGLSVAFKYWKVEPEIVHRVLGEVYSALQQLLKEIQAKLSQLSEQGQSAGSEQEVLRIEQELLQNYEVLYLCAKVCSKSVMDSYRLCQHHHNLASRLIGYLQASHEAMKPAACDWGSLQPHTPFFYFMHANKWILKYLEKYIEIVLPIRRISKALFQYSSIIFYEQHGPALLRMLADMLSIDEKVQACENLSKVHYHELRLLQKLAQNRPALFANNYHTTKQFMQQIIPYFVMLKPHDVRFLTEEPSQYIDLEHSASASELCNPRDIAVSVWLKLAGLDRREQAQRADTFWSLAVSLLQEWVKSESEAFLQVGLFLLRKMKELFWKEFQAHREITLGMSQRICEIFAATEAPVLNVRVLQCVSCFCLQLPVDFLLKLRSWIIMYLQRCYQCTQGWQAFTCIHAVFALGKLFCRAELRQLPPPLVKQLLHCTISMVQSLSVEGIMVTLETMVRCFAAQLPDLAQDLLCKMSAMVQQYFQKDAQQLQNLGNARSFNQNYEAIAARSFSVIATFISLIKAQISCLGPLIQQQILELSFFILRKPSLQMDSYFQNYLSVVARYVYSVQKGELSDSIWAIYRVLVFRVIALSERQLKAVRALPNSEWKDMLLTCTTREHYHFQQYLDVFRAYMKHLDASRSLRTLSEVGQDVIEASEAQLLVYMVAQYYQKKRQESQDYGKIFTFLLMSYALEAQGQRMHRSLKNFIFKVVRVIGADLPRKGFLTKYVLQTFFLWAYHQDDAHVLLTLKQIGDRCASFLLTMLNNHKLYGIKELREPRQVTRAILGLGKLLFLSLQHQLLTQHRHMFATWLIYFLHADCVHRGLALDDSDIDDFQQDDDGLAYLNEEIVERQLQNEAAIEATNSGGMSSGGMNSGGMNSGGMNSPGSLFDFSRRRESQEEYNYQIESDEYDIDENDNMEDNIAPEFCSSMMFSVLKTLVILQEKCPEEYQQFVEEDYQTADRLYDVLDCLNLLQSKEFKCLTRNIEMAYYQEGEDEQQYQQQQLSQANFKYSPQTAIWAAKSPTD